jgi:hypothetical protein
MHEKMMNTIDNVLCENGFSIYKTIIYVKNIWTVATVLYKKHKKNI